MPATPVLAAIHVLILLNFWWGPVRLTSARANAIAILVGLFLAWTLVAIALRIRPKPVRITAAIAAVLWALLCAFFGFFVLLWATAVLATGVDNTFESISTFNLQNHRLVGYRTNGGAMTQFGIVVREERQLIPGIKLVHVVASAYPADEVEMRSAGDETVRIQIHQYGHYDGQSSEPAVRLLDLHTLWY